MIDVKNIIVDSNLYSALALCCKGDSIIVKTQFPVLGVKGITGLNIDGGYSSLKMEFRVSVDSVLWSDWMLLTLGNLQSFDLDKRHPFQIEYKFTCLRSTRNYIYSIDLEFEYEEPKVPTSYPTTPFEQFFPFLNRQSLLWATNVLEKFYKSGIVPEFISRGENKDWEDKDYLDFWWVSIYFQALKISYDSVFKETLYRPDLLEDFLRQRDLFPGTKKDLGSLYYLCTNYYNEMRRRGTDLVKSDKYILPEEYIDIEVKGELLRLLNCKSQDVENFTLTGSDIGWYVGSSSPTFNSGTSVENIIKGYEFGKEFKDFSAYPFINPNFIKKEATLLEGKLVNCIFMNPKSFGFTGFGFSGVWADMSKYAIRVNPKFSYEITFLMKGGDLQTLELGVTCFNNSGHSLGNLTTIKNEGLETSTFFKGRLSPSKTQNFNFVRVIIWSIDSEEIPNSSVEGLKKGSNLRFKKPGTTSIIPLIRLKDNGGEGIYLYDFKVRPCKINTSRYISQEDLLYLRVISQDGDIPSRRVENIINDKLVPYNLGLVLETEEHE